MPEWSGLRVANETLAFLLELAALGALGYWGWQAGPNLAARLALVIGVPLLAAVVWALFAAPRARFSLPLPGVLLTKALVFGAATAALYATAGPAVAIGYGILVIVNTTVVTATRAGDPV